MPPSLSNLIQKRTRPVAAAKQRADNTMFHPHKRGKNPLPGG